MKNYVQPGHTITITAPYPLSSGDGLIVGSIFGVSTRDAANSEAVEAALIGVFDLKKSPSQAWSVGDKIYWDNNAKEATKTPTGNILIGAAVEPAMSGASEIIGRVRLNGSV